MSESFIGAVTNLADLYVGRFVHARIEACPHLEEDPWDSLRFFVLGYAFEHKILSPDCARAAIDAIEEARGRPLTRGAALRVWRAYSERMQGKGLTHANNPLCPQGTSYTRRQKDTMIERRTRGISAVELAAEELEGQPIVPWARASMESGRLAKAHRLLTMVNGASETTASYFLRDVATMSGLTPSEERHLLQPVDSWVMAVARACSGDSKLNSDGCASFILSCPRPEQVTQGIWYFCTHVAGGSKRQVELSLADPDHLSFLLDQHLRALVVGGEAAITFVSRRQPGLLSSQARLLIAQEKGKESAARKS